MHLPPTAINIVFPRTQVKWPLDHTILEMAIVLDAQEDAGKVPPVAP